MIKPIALLVGIQPNDITAICQTLEPIGWQVNSVETPSQSRQLLVTQKPPLLLVSTERQPLFWLKEVQSLEIPTQIIALIEKEHLEESLDWISEGVYNVIVKPLSAKRLNKLATQLLAQNELYHEIIALEKNSSQTPYELAEFYAGLIGHLTAASLQEYLRSALKRLTGAQEVSLVLKESWLKRHSSLTADFKFENSTLNDRPSETAIASNFSPHCLEFELLGKSDSFGSLKLHFFTKEALKIKQEEIFAQLISKISAAWELVGQYHQKSAQAACDSLTGLYNRRIFEEVLEKEFSLAKRHGHPLSLISLDLDHFKSVNDTYGHQSGDIVLKKVAQTIEKVVRTSDLAARIGGEEFAIILPHTTFEQALSMARRLRLSILRVNFNISDTFHQTISQGLVSTEHFLVKSPEDMIYWSDKALYLAKREGRDTVRTVLDLPLTTPMKDGSYAFQ